MNDIKGLQQLENLACSFLAANQHVRAEEVCHQILAWSPEHARGHFLLGIAQQSLTNSQAARKSFEKAIQIHPQYVEAHVNLGNVLHTLGEYYKAIDCYVVALRLAPNLATTYFNLAGTQQKIGKLQEAISSLEIAVQLSPRYARAYQRRGDVHVELAQLDAAIVAYQNAVAIAPDDARSLTAMGVVLRRLGRFEEAACAYRAALSFAPNSADALMNLGNVSLDLGQYEEAIAYHEKSVSLKPECAIAHCNLGQTLQTVRRFEDALVCYQRAIDIDSSYPKAHFNRSLVLLLMGDFARGFEEYEWRWKESLPKPLFNCPEWDGGLLFGKTILLYSEQGLGDTLQFIRFVDHVRRRSPKKIVVQCQKALFSLLQDFPGIDQLVTPGSEMPSLDVCVSLMSLPYTLKLDVADFATQTPYLYCCAQFMEIWREETKRWKGFNVGIAWQGSTSHPKDRFRSIPLSSFSELAELPGVNLISLQNGYGTEQIQDIDFPLVNLTDRLDKTNGPFVDTAALIANLDLVITIDSALAHLAGAMGVPVWVVLNTQHDWRWMKDRTNCLWYPTMRLFRQNQPNDWGEVLGRIRAELMETVNTFVRAESTKNSL
jgi:tetratricopeptide (TPR) repeat protein